MPEKTDHDLILEVHQVLLGTNGQGGICRQVDCHGKAINRIWITLAVIVAGVGGGGYGATTFILKSIGG